MDARMTVSEIARRMKKDKSWVSRTIKKLQMERTTEHQSPKERELVVRNHAILESLLSKALTASERGTAKEKLAGAKLALDVMRQKSEYELSVGLVQHRDQKNTEFEDFVARLDEELPDEALIGILKIRQQIEERRDAKKTKLQGAGTPFRVSVQPVAQNGGRNPKIQLL